jgi:hypothetical protein
VVWTPPSEEVLGYQANNLVGQELAAKISSGIAGLEEPVSKDESGEVNIPSDRVIAEAAISSGRHPDPATANPRASEPASSQARSFVLKFQAPETNP